jgi:hypothetical protein
LSESIGSVYPTLIPSLSETADIQAALRLYHYGSTTIPATPATAVANSIAGALYNLQTQITSISGSLGVQASNWTGKGALVSASAASTLSTLTVSLPADDGKVLTVDSVGSPTTGLRWALPEVTASSVTTFTNKTLTNPTINAGSGTLVLPGSNTPAQTADGSIVWDLDSDLLTVGTGAGRKTMVDTDSTQTLTNKTLTAPTVTQLFLSDSVVVFEGSTPDVNETTLGVIDPTADRTINLPNNSGTVALVADTTFIGTTSVALNRSSANLALTGISSVALPGSTSGTITLQPTATAGTNTITLPASTGTVALQTDITFIGTTSVALNRSSANLALTGISSIALPGSTSGTITLQSTATAGTNTITLPAATGTVALTSNKISDFAAVTSSELAGKISDETGTGVIVFSDSPALSGTPTAPTASANTNTTQIATTAYAYQLEDFIVIALSDETTNITTGTAKLTWRAPFAMTLTQIPRASLNTASTSGNPTVDINEAGTSILGVNKLSIDANELTSVTAATPTTLADTAIADNAVITFDIDVAGTGAKGLKVILYYKRA